MVRAKLYPPIQMTAAWMHHSGPLPPTVYANTYNPIGTGPWPDDEDTGDPPPSTQPVPNVAPYADPTAPGTIFGINRSPKPLLAQSMGSTKATKPVACGATCKKCNEYNEYAESNQADGTYVCYGCR